jgi:hypothetical protein
VKCFGQEAVLVYCISDFSYYLPHCTDKYCKRLIVQKFKLRSRTAPAASSSVRDVRFPAMVASRAGPGEASRSPDSPCVCSVLILAHIYLLVMEGTLWKEGWNGIVPDKRQNVPRWVLVRPAIISFVLSALCRNRHGEFYNSKLDLNHYLSNRNGEFYWKYAGKGFDIGAKNIIFQTIEVT